MDDDWREDGSLRSLNAGSQGKARGKGKGPQFTRVIPKFLQKYHQPPTIQAKFATLPKAGEEEDEGLDEVQQAAIDDYLAKKEGKKKEKTAEDSDDDGEEYGKDVDKKKQSKTSGQNVVEMGKTKAADTTSKKKRKRSDRLTLSNKKLLSFSMDDE